MFRCLSILLVLRVWLISRGISCRIYRLSVRLVLTLPTRGVGAATATEQIVSVRVPHSPVLLNSCVSSNQNQTTLKILNNPIVLVNFLVCFPLSRIWDFCSDLQRCGSQTISSVAEFRDIWYDISIKTGKGVFGTVKTTYGLARISAHLQEPTFCVIGIALLLLNLSGSLMSAPPLFCHLFVVTIFQGLRNST